MDTADARLQTKHEMATKVDDDAPIDNDERLAQTSESDAPIQKPTSPISALLSLYPTDPTAKRALSTETDKPADNHPFVQLASDQTSPDHESADVADNSVSASTDDPPYDQQQQQSIQLAAHEELIDGMIAATLPKPPPPPKPIVSSQPVASSTSEDDDNNNQYHGELYERGEIIPLYRNPAPRKIAGFVIEDAEFDWTLEAVSAAAAFGGLTMAPHLATPTTVARLVGVSPQQIKQWRRCPDFNRRVDAIIRKSADEIFDSGMSIKAARILALQRRHAELTSVIEARQEWALEHAENDIVHDFESGESFHIPGVSSGTIAITYKTIGSAENQRTIIEGHIDAPLLRELREIEKQLAQELGQWSNSDSVNVNLKLYAGIDINAV